MAVEGELASVMALCSSRRRIMARVAGISYTADIGHLCGSGSLEPFSPLADTRQETKSGAKMTEYPESLLSEDIGVLVVDDTVQYAKVLEKMLQSGFGYQKVDALYELDPAYEQIKANADSYQLLFVDYNFPNGRTGIELLQKLREEGLLEGKVFFLITADPNDENLKEAAEAGAMGVVAKPFDMTQLKSQLEKAERFVQSSRVESF